MWQKRLKAVFIDVWKEKSTVASTNKNQANQAALHSVSP